jgi:predicted GNAT family N-acyltransferase
MGTYIIIYIKARYQREFKMTSAYISYDIQEDPIFDDEGDEVGTDKYWLICKMYTPEAERGKGIARRLMTEALSEMSSKCPSLDVRLWCEPQDDLTDGELLMAFYESFGFEATGNGAEMKL